jgi:hypothetical protein
MDMAALMVVVGIIWLVTRYRERVGYFHEVSDLSKSMQEQVLRALRCLLTLKVSSELKGQRNLEVRNSRRFLH